MSPLDTWGRVFQAEGTESAKALQTNKMIQENRSVYSMKELLALWSQPDSDSKLGYKAVSDSNYLAILCPHFLTSEIRFKSSKTM